MLKAATGIQPKKHNLKGRHFLALADYSGEEIQYLLELASEIKAMHKQGRQQPLLQGKVLGMIFEKSSTRTRVSFEAAMLQLGGHAIFLSSKDIQLGRGESISDTAKVLSRYVDGIMVRTFGHEKIESFADSSSVPVINGLTDEHHPAQVLADLLTIYEKKNKLKGLKLAYLGDGSNNMAHSLLEGAVKTGMDISIGCPESFSPLADIEAAARAEAEISGSKVVIEHNPAAAVSEADVVVTDVWTSMGQEEEEQKRFSILSPYQVNEKLCRYAKKDFMFLHCLPAHRGEEVTADIIDGPHSHVFDEAENRLHAQKAVLTALLS
ncbi:ornithine carbamoyltransferase [Bacillus lacus]|uniref:Ornithine carbamoyltransferase n=1 Tax=Metabacillus lacus TaxID=1983721 RepID=A0A7X2IZ46_9BACI|nr:ornithine carbamoyltransferase [Metabacillus lacus]MRX72465.1 ornithine carbamoyltransferase [Metabacillus lacus]